MDRGASVSSEWVRGCDARTRESGRGKRCPSLDAVYVSVVIRFKPRRSDVAVDYAFLQPVLMCKGRQECQKPVINLLKRGGSTLQKRCGRYELNYPRNWRRPFPWSFGSCKPDALLAHPCLCAAMLYNIRLLVSRPTVRIYYA